LASLPERVRHAGQAAPSPATATRLHRREFDFGDEDFESLRRLARELTGIRLTESKRDLVYGRLSRRLRALRLTSFREYRTLLAANGGGTERTEFCNAITTNLTSFFRECHHFDHLRGALLETLAAERPGRRVRLWSAGCSTGEEPWSLAMTIAEAVPDFARRDIRILATDIDSAVLAQASAGTYAPERVAGLEPARLARHFRDAAPPGQRQYTVTPELAALVTFRQLNLMAPLPMRGPFDAIFCRNVVIYFDEDSRRSLFARMARLQRPGDLLFIGHSETLLRVSDDYTLVGRTVYRRNGP